MIEANLAEDRPEDESAASPPPEQTAGTVARGLRNRWISVALPVAVVLAALIGLFVVVRAGWLVIAAGLAMTGLLAAYLLTLTRRVIADVERAEELARANAALANEIAERERAEAALAQERDRLEVTLHSIGDAVITTDAEGGVQYLNPVAESLTGWPLEEARGRQLAAVFRIVSESSGKRAADPVRRCLEENRAPPMARDIVLISRPGRKYGIQASAAPIRAQGGDVLGVVLVFNDVTEARQLAQEAVRQASHDPLTDLINRREFERRLEHSVASAKQYGLQHALCYLDLDQFKIVNDTVGHMAGDELLKQVTVLLRKTVRSRDTLARLGGDEFGLLLNNCPLAKAVEIAEMAVAEVRGFRFVWKERAFQLGVSIGLVPIVAGAEGTAKLLAQADVACYSAKDAGRNRVHVYEGEGSSSRRHAQMVRAAELRGAVEEDRFRLFCQPIVPLADPAEPVHYELLLRMLDTEGKIVPPNAFIPAAERYGLMAAIDRWVIRTAFGRYRELFHGPGSSQIAINLSGNTLNDESLFDFIQERMLEHEIPPLRVCFEITETAAIHNLSRVTRFIVAMKESGCRFALDDFGSGLSSLTYLKNLPVDYLKIDGSFVRNMTEDAVDRAMVSAINEVGHTTGLRTVAEHVHSDEIVEILREMGIDYAQGYALGRPRPVEEIIGDEAPASGARESSCPGPVVS